MIAWESLVVILFVLLQLLMILMGEGGNQE